MSNFLEELTMHVADSQVLKYTLGHEGEAEVVNEYSVAAALGMIDSLGENARRMLEIGMVQDKLVELGFIINRSDYPYEYWKDEYFVHFLHETVVTGVKINKDYPDWESFNYTSPTWQDDLIAKVEDLIKSAQPLD